eukprot:TRINITY_DN403_c0_g1_i1.p3 TRINITY_DN403_c0_g1~~TRINITY_DN403_c0_g1_i1.p3  ORF type:complete len:66 (-),score=4.09 TRINITY_DN403_c0_g1_i1:379-576(-)
MLQLHVNLNGSSFAFFWKLTACLRNFPFHLLLLETENFFFVRCIKDNNEELYNDNCGQKRNKSTI